MKNKLVLFLLFLSPLTYASVLNPITDGDDSKKETAPNSASVIASTWEFYSDIDKIKTEDLTAARNHKLGKEAGYLYELFVAGYVQKEEVVPGDPGVRTVIRKPNVYNAVRYVEKELNKKLKKNEITKDEAAARFTHALRVALAVIDSDSESFEDTLQSNRKDADKLLQLFANVTLKNIYQ